MRDWIGILVILAVSSAIVTSAHPAPQSLCFGRVFVVAGECRY